MCVPWYVCYSMYKVWKFVLRDTYVRISYLYLYMIVLLMVLDDSPCPLEKPPMVAKWTGMADHPTSTVTALSGQGSGV